MLEIRQGTLYLTPRPEDYVWNQTINIFFTSLAQDQREHAIGVVLSGMGTDGAAGALMLYRHGGEGTGTTPGGHASGWPPDLYGA